MSPSPATPARCSIARTLEVLGDKWTLLIVRDAFWGHSRFSEFTRSLGVASDVLTARLAMLVDEGILERRAYRQEGSRERQEYVLTEKGKQLHVVIGALGQYGRDHLPRPGSTSPEYTEETTGEAVSLAFVTGDGRRVSASSLRVQQSDPALTAGTQG
jgi:DNA-binding HxlR family transcriptional regulator